MTTKSGGAPINVYSSTQRVLRILRDNPNGLTCPEILLRGHFNNLNQIISALVERGLVVAVDRCYRFSNRKPHNVYKACG